MAFLLSRVMFYVMASMHDPSVDERLAPRETHWESWDSGISALSARPNDGIHLLFYGHSWSSVAPIWPKAHNLSFPSSSLFALFLALLFFILSFALVFLSHFHLIRSPTCSQRPIFSPHLHPPPYSPPPSFTFPSFLCGSLPWCSFYGQQPRAPHLS